MKAKTVIKIIIVIAVILGIGVSLFLRWSGTREIALFNSSSMMDWKLGGKIVGIESVDDARNYDPEHFVYFSDKNGSGLKAISSNTRYYLDYFQDGSCRVIGFSTTEKHYSVMGVQVGANELDSKTLLLNEGYRMNGGGLDSCRARDGKITVYLEFEHGIVTGIAAFLDL